MLKLSSIACTVFLLAGAGAASATQTEVLILSALGNSTLDNDIIAKIAPNAPFLHINVLPVDSGTPLLSTLEAYKAIMVVGSQQFKDAIKLGDELKQYIDDGHGLIVTAFSNTLGNCTFATNSQLCGAFDASHYWAIDPGTQVSPNSHAVLGTVVLPLDPIFAGVGAGAVGFDGGAFSSRTNGAVDTNATLVAKWDDNRPFAATRTFGSGALEIGLNFMPVSGDGYLGNWLVTSEGGLILANAFNEVAGVNGASDPGEVPEPGTYVVVGGGLGLLALLMRRRPGTLQCESVQRLRQR